MIRSKSKASIPALALGLALLHLSTAAAHPNHEMDAARITLYRWSEALIGNDVDALEPLLHEQFVGAYGQSRKDYLRRLRIDTGVIEANIRDAIYEDVGANIRAGPIVLTYSRHVKMSAFAVELTYDLGEWKILSLTPVALPQSLEPTSLAEQLATVPMHFDLVDAESGKPVFARVSVYDETGEYWPPREHEKHVRIGWGEDVGGDVNISGKNFAYVRPRFTIDLPAGRYELRAAKGMEYREAIYSFEVRPGDSVTSTIVLPRWSNIGEKGWYSGDTHTHFLDDHSALLEARAEDLNVINVLATKWGELITNAQQVIGKPSPVSDVDHVVYFNEEARHDVLGHLILHPITNLIHPLSWGDGGAGVAGGFDFPPTAYQADKAHEQGGLATLAHFSGSHLEPPIDVALRKIDSVDLFTWGDAFRRSSTAFDGKEIPGPVEYYYKFLNTGFRLPVTAGTDKMLNTQVAGSVRTYALLETATFSYPGWIKAVRHGRTFVTTGPMLSLSVDSHGVGSVLSVRSGASVTVRADVASLFSKYPVKRLELVRNGSVIATVLNDKALDLLELSVDVTVDEPSWFAARAYNDILLPYNTWSARGPMDGSPVMAHTSPIYVEIPGRQLWFEADAEFLLERCDAAIEWARSKARFETDLQRLEVIALFEQARRVFVNGPEVP